MIYIECVIERKVNVMFAIYEKNALPEFVQKLLADVPMLQQIECVVLFADTWVRTGEKVRKDRSDTFYEKLLTGFKSNQNYKSHTKELTAAEINEAGIPFGLAGAAFAQKYKIMWVI